MRDHSDKIVGAKVVGGWENLGGHNFSADATKDDVVLLHTSQKLQYAALYARFSILLRSFALLCNGHPVPQDAAGVSVAHYHALAEVC